MILVNLGIARQKESLTYCYLYEEKQFYIVSDFIKKYLKFSTLI